jgi:hypothetical protein
MQLSEFTLRIVFLFIPGIISFVIIDKLTVHKESRIHNILISSLILGFICYSSYYSIILVVNQLVETDLKFSFLTTLTKKDAELNFREISIVAGLSVPVGFVFTFLINYKILDRIAHWLRISNKFGDIDVWSYIMNSKVPEWAVIRDIENDLMYEGWVQAFSDSTGEDEVFLRDVKVYKNSTAEELYETPGLYLPRKRQNLTVEFPLLKFSKYRERPSQEEEK